MTNLGKSQHVSGYEVGEKEEKASKIFVLFHWRLSVLISSTY